MLAHSFERFYIVTKFILPSMGDLKISNLNYDNTCLFRQQKHLQYRNKETYVRYHYVLLKIEPSVMYYKRLIKS